MNNEEMIEKIGNAVDRIDNCVAGLDMPLPPKIHMDSLREILPDIANELKDVFFALGGDKDTWEY